MKKNRILVCLVFLLFSSNLYTKEKIIGDYINEIQFEVCRLNISAPQELGYKTGDGKRCSANFMGGNTFLTAAHCLVDSEGNKIENIRLSVDCHCPPSLTSRMFNGQVNDSKIHHKYTLEDSKKRIFSRDLGIVKTSTPFICKTSKMKGFSVANDLKEVIEIKKNNDCYLSGFGIDNKSFSGTQHTVKAPVVGYFQVNEEIEDAAKHDLFWLSYPFSKDDEVNRFARLTFIDSMALRVLQNEIESYPFYFKSELAKVEAGKESRLTREELKASEKIYGNNKIVYDILKKKLEADPVKSRAMSGDSGGAYFCKNTEGNRYLIGVISGGGDQVPKKNQPIEGKTVITILNTPINESFWK